jgi:hypothetical protein
MASVRWQAKQVDLKPPPLSRSFSSQDRQILKVPGPKMNLLCAKSLIAGEEHQETDDSSQTVEERECDGVNVDSRSANSATIGGRLPPIQGGVCFIVVPILHLYFTNTQS